MKLTYWVVKNNDCAAYHQRFRLRRIAFSYWRSSKKLYEIDKPLKVEVEYKDAFSLVCTVLQEGGAEN